MKHKLDRAYQQIRTWVHDHKRLSLVIAIFVVVLFVFGVSALFLGGNDEVARTDPTTEAVDEPEAEPTVPSPLTGRPVSQEEANRPVTAIVIENSPDARPQSSLHQAGVVFESIAEGGITRFLAFYQETRPDPIGPVRSLRPYFIDWALAFDASVAHVGGSAQALSEARSVGMKDLDQFANGASYYRTTDRYAPHNVYTDFKKLDALNTQLGYTSSDFEPFPRKAAKKLATPKASKITIPISSFTYEPSYVYDKPSNTYLRRIAGAPDKDRESGKRLAPNVVVVIEASYTVAGDGRYHYNLIGTGKATVFQDGNVQVGSWRKPARDSMMTFTNDNGDIIKFNPGQVWIAAISPSQEVEYTP